MWHKRRINHEKTNVGTARQNIVSLLEIMLPQCMLNADAVNTLVFSTHFLLTCDVDNRSLHLLVNALP